LFREYLRGQSQIGGQDWVNQELTSTGDNPCRTRCDENWVIIPNGEAMAKGFRREVSILISGGGQREDAWCIPQCIGQPKEDNTVRINKFPLCCGREPASLFEVPCYLELLLRASFCLCYEI
jgi:hypothetical protein